MPNYIIIVDGMIYIMGGSTCRSRDKGGGREAVPLQEPEVDWAMRFRARLPQELPRSGLCWGRVPRPSSPLLLLQELLINQLI